MEIRRGERSGGASVSLESAASVGRSQAAQVCLDAIHTDRFKCAQKRIGLQILRVCGLLRFCCIRIRHSASKQLEILQILLVDSPLAGAASDAL